MGISQGRPRRTRRATIAREFLVTAERVLAQVRSGQYPLTQFQRDPVRYVRERLHVPHIMPHQAAILQSLANGVAGKAVPRVAVRSGQKSGKSATAIWAALWFYESFAESQVLLTAAIEAQTRAVLWKELHDTLRRARAAGSPIDGGDDEGKPSANPSTGFVSSDRSRIIRGVSGRDIEALAGISGRQLMVVDEASHLPQAKSEVFVGNQMGGGGALLFISNPTANSGPFYDAFHSHQSWWQTYHVDCLKVAQWQKETGIRIPFTTNTEKIEEARMMYGEESPFWAWRVRGEFLRNETGRAIPMVRIEGAVARWPVAPEEGRLTIGYDPAGDGLAADEHAWSVVRGVKCLAIRRRRALSEESGLEETYSLLATHRVDGEVPRVIVDSEGPIGSAIYGRLRAESERREQQEPWARFQVWGVKASSRHVRQKEKFDRVRDELVWNLSQWLIEGAIPADSKLHSELYAPVWESDSSGKLRCTSKNTIRDKLGRSPDSFDALALGVWAPIDYTEHLEQAAAASAAARQAPREHRLERELDPYASPGYGDTGLIDPYGAMR